MTVVHINIKYILKDINTNDVACINPKCKQFQSNIANKKTDDVSGKQEAYAVWLILSVSLVLMFITSQK